MSDKDADASREDVIASVHTGVNAVDDETPLGVSDDDEYDFELEPEPIFNRLASQIYERNSAGAREALTNAVTSVLRAKERGYLEEGEVTIRFDLYHGGEAGTDYLTIRDNGMGMSLAEIDNVVSVIGATTAREEGELAGQFGMGFLALFKLCGLNESFVMHSNSRLTDNPPFSGIWNAKRFTHDTNGELQTALDDDEYGVRFDFELADSIDAESFATSLREISQHARVPVIITEYDPDGTVRTADTVGGETLLQDIEDDALYIEYEDEYVHAIAADDAVNDETLLLDVPVSRGRTQFRFDVLPWRFPNVLVRLKNEKGIVVDGPNEGLMVANAREYEAMENEGIADNFIRETELADNDIHIPRPIGSRDRLEESDAFWEWLADRLEDRYQEKVTQIVENIETVDDIYQLDEQSYHLFSNRLPEPDIDGDDASFDDCYNPDTYSDALEDSFGTGLSQLSSELNLLACELPTVYPGVSDAASASNHQQRRLLPTAREAYGPDATGAVYMGVTINNDRAAVVWEDNADNRLIALPSSDWYDALADELDFEYLKHIKASTLDSFDVSDDVQERLLDTTEETKSYRDTEITLHFGRHKRRSQTKNATVTLGTLLDATQNSDGRYNFAGFTPHTIIGFPRQGTYNLTNRKGRLSSEDVAVASFTQPQWELAQDHEAVTLIDDYIEAARATSFHTSDGMQTLDTLPEDADLVVHALPQRTAPLFQTEAMMAELATILSNDEWATESLAWGTDSTDVLYAPVEQATFEKLRPALDEYGVQVLATNVKYAYDDPGELMTGPRDATLYLLGRCPDMRLTETIRIVEAGLERERVSLVDERETVEEIVRTLTDRGN